MMMESKDILPLTDTDAADCSITKQFPQSVKHLQKAVTPKSRFIP